MAHIRRSRLLPAARIRLRFLGREKAPKLCMLLNRV